MNEKTVGCFVRTPDGVGTLRMIEGHPYRIGWVELDCGAVGGYSYYTVYNEQTKASELLILNPYNFETLEAA
jgi:hypothetical protein